MNENIDLTKILDGCPEGTVFYSSIHDEVKFLHIDKSIKCPIVTLYDYDYYAMFGKDARRNIQTSQYQSQKTTENH